MWNILPRGSVNPSLVPGARGETEIGVFAAGWLRGKGLEVHLQETGSPGRQNVIAVARGSGGGRSLLLNAHMDTVGVAGMDAPFRAVDPRREALRPGRDGHERRTCGLHERGCRRARAEAAR